MTYKPPIHGKDHCPGGPDPIPCLGAWGWAHKTTDQVIASGIVKVLDWDTNAVAPGQSVIDVSSTPITNPLQFTQTGIYSMVYWVNWGDLGFADTRTIFAIRASGTTQIAALQWPTSSARGGPSSTLQFSSASPLLITADPLGPTIPEFRVYHEAGTSKTIITAGVVVAFHGATKAFDI